MRFVIPKDFLPISHPQKLKNVKQCNLFIYLPIYPSIYIVHI